MPDAKNKQLYMMSIKLIKLFFSFLLFCPAMLCAQSIISGKVLDENEQAIPGVNIMIKGTTTGTTSDLDGNFQLSAPGDATLVLSFIGYKRKEVDLNNQTEITIPMEVDISQLDEVVVIGYGTTKKANLTTSVATLKAKDIEGMPVASFDQAIQGRVAGVQVTKSTGAPGGGISIRIRGTASINGGQEPLYVVDGVPINNSFTNSAAEGGASGGFAGNEQINGLAGINTDDIESIEILKDAAAASIYGSRGANGVVLITTKQGVSGKPAVNINSYTGIAFIPRRYELLNGTQYAAAVNEGLINSGNPSNDIVRYDGIETDWQDEIFTMGTVHNTTVGFGGGNENTNYYFSTGYFGQEGTIINSNFRRISFRANIDHSFSSKFKAGIKTTLGLTTSNRLRNSGGANVQDAFNDNNVYGASVLASALVMSPLVPIIDPNTGNYATDTLNAIQNPVEVALTNNLVNNGLRFIGSLYFDWTLLKGLSWYNSIGGDIRDENETFSRIPPPQGGGGSILKRSFYENLIELRSYLTYNYDFKNNSNVNVILGTSYQTSSNDGFSIGVRDLVSSQIKTLIGGSEITSPGVDADNGYNIFSNYSRLNINFLDRYLFSGTVRIDGSSRFGPNKRYGFFPSASVGWKISEEAFFDVSQINELKLRVSYGTTGNDRIPSYRYLGTLQSLANNYLGRNGLILQNVENPNYSWEQTQELNVGIDIGLYENKFQITANWYDKITDDLLLGRGLPAVAGVPFSPFVNIGSMKNTGLEFSINASLINTENFGWSSNFNISTNRNEILSLVDGDVTTGNYGYASVARVGEPIFFQLFQLEEKVDPATGYLKIKDLNGDGIITGNSDLTRVGSPLPKHFGGFQNDFYYKNFDFSIFFQWVYGNDIINNTRGFLQDTGRPGIARTGNNLSVEALNRWVNEGDDTDFPRIDYAKPGFEDTSPFNLSKPTDRNLEDGSFLKLRNISFGYNLPKKMLSRINFQSVRIGLTAFNILTLTRYTGFDPEVNHDVTAGIGIGYDNGTYPQSSMMTFNLNIGL